MSDVEFEDVSLPRKTVSSGEISLAGSLDEERTQSDTEIPKVLQTKVISTKKIYFCSLTSFFRN